MSDKFFRAASSKPRTGLKYCRRDSAVFSSNQENILIYIYI